MKQSMTRENISSWTTLGHWRGWAAASYSVDMHLRNACSPLFLSPLACSKKNAKRNARMIIYAVSLKLSLLFKVMPFIRDRFVEDLGAIVISKIVHALMMSGCEHSEEPQTYFKEKELRKKIAIQNNKNLKKDFFFI
ncbi:MAG: hypothetical protein EZS28_041501 [Streblomastix strix]|uniref:Uncharacterized protein n=1 Tax=Streblomastix strix TaxID=222440 RepID=A0A5J4TYZ7_9EUKA|nr:MAG: hypothetical protein EZS28_041501 [Streblomastix strix]